MTRRGIEQRSAGSVVNTLTVKPMSGYIYLQQNEKYKKQDIQGMYIFIDAYHMLIVLVF